jgi:hypothetical protein
MGILWLLSYTTAVVGNVSMSWLRKVAHQDKYVDCHILATETLHKYPMAVVAMQLSHSARLFENLSKCFT